MVIPVMKLKSLSVQGLIGKNSKVKSSAPASDPTIYDQPLISKYSKIFVWVAPFTSFKPIAMKKSVSS